MLCSQYFHIIVTCGQKNNFSKRIKLEPITTYYLDLDFIVKVLLKYCGRSTH